jgi:hypothetical protein
MMVLFDIALSGDSWISVYSPHNLQDFKPDRGAARRLAATIITPERFVCISHHSPLLAAGKIIMPEQACSHGAPGTPDRADMFHDLDQ